MEDVILILITIKYNGGYRGCFVHGYRDAIRDDKSRSKTGLFF